MKMASDEKTYVSPLLIHIKRFEIFRAVSW